METTRLSTRGQIVLPWSIRASRAWGSGTEFTVEETPDGLLLRPVGRFHETDLDMIAGCLRSRRKSKTPVRTQTAVEREVIAGGRDRGFDCAVRLNALII